MVAILDIGYPGRSLGYGCNERESGLTHYSRALLDLHSVSPLNKTGGW